MSAEDLQRQTTVNVQEKANLIWAIADKLVGVYKPHEYGNVILPMCVIKRFEDTLAPTRDAVWKKNEELDAHNISVKKGFLENAAGYKFYNLSKFTFETLLADPDNIRDNFESYLSHFSENVIDILRRFDFDKEIKKMADEGLLYLVIKEFDSEKAYLGIDKVTAFDMGYIFEELVRKFSESYDEQAGAHFTARDIIDLMSAVLVAGDEDELRTNGVVATIYDMAMGTSQMLSRLSDKLMEIDPDAEITTYGQELNNQTFAIAKADTLIRGGNADNMRQGDTLGNDQFSGYQFDYIISNPPFGIEWKTSKKEVEEEYNLGDAGRFSPGLPAVGDGQMLFLLNGVAKLKDAGRMAIIQNGSSLFKGDAGSGESEIRGYLLEHDWLDAIIQLPNDLFYNTGIATYIWIVTKDKKSDRTGKVQLIDASNCYEKRRKSLGNKRVELTGKCISMIVEAYNDFTGKTYTDEENQEIKVESKVKDNDDFKYSKVFTQRPLRLYYEELQLTDEQIAGMNKADVEVLQNVVKASHDLWNGHRVSDFALFTNLKVHDIKVPASKVALVRNILGTKDTEAEEAHVKPADIESAIAPDPDLKDSEIIPWKQNVDEYLEKNVRPYAPDYWYNPEDTKIGYEIPFTREFYKYEAPRKSSDIFAHLQELEKQEQELLNKILG